MSENSTPTVHSAPYLSRITLRNFKSVVSQDVSLAPLTLIVGENSSGKSSLFQAVRLMQQAARSKTSGDSFPLNGDSINVGNIEDVRSVQAKEEKSVTIGFDTSIPYSYLNSNYEYHKQYECREEVDPYPGLEESKERDDCSFCLHYWSIDDWPTGSKENSFIIKWAVDLVAGKSRSTTLKNLHFSLTDIHGNRELYISTNRQEVYNKSITLSGALPNALFVKQITVLYLAYELITQMITYPKKGLSTDKEGGKQLIEYVLENIAEWTGFEFPKTIYKIPGIVDLGHELINNKTSLDPFSLIPVIASHLEIEDQEWPELEVKHPNLARTSGAPLGGMSVFAPPTEDWLDKLDEQEIIQLLSSSAPDRPSSVYIYSPQVLIAGAYYLDKLCDNNIKYLGPLREPPDQPTPRASLGKTGDIGQSGEFTASVLQRFGNEEVSVPTPGGELAEMPLIEAVQEWGRRLGLLQTIRVVQEANLGNTIKVKSEGLNKEVRLNAVGVGVSQLLPVLVLCLLSKPGSMILLEQPELHLHPALQQRLADFLIAAVRSGRQLIVETHSEYIVSRLRRRIAEDTSDEDALLFMSKIVFAERDSQTGVTTYREVELSPFGKIEDWPIGFFDQASEEEREIIRSGFRKIADREERMKETADRE